MLRRLLRYSLILLALAAIVAGGGWFTYERQRDPERLLKSGRAAVASKNWDEAEVFANRLIAYNHRDHGRLLRGESLYRQKRTGSAIEALNKVGPESPLRFEAASIQGLCLLELGNQREAERVFRFILKERPDDLESNRGLAVIAYDQGLWTEAEKFLQKVADLDPADGRAYRTMGNIDLDLQIFDTAERHLRLALERTLPGEMPALTRADLALALAGQKKYAEALAELEKANLDNASRNMLRLRVDCLRSVGRIDEASRQVELDLAIRPNDAGLMAEKGMVLLERRQLDDSIEWLEKSLALDAHDVMARTSLMRAYQESGKTEAAREQKLKIGETERALKKLTDLTYEAMKKPWDAPVRRQLAEACTSLNKTELARMWLIAARACEKR